MRLRNTFHIGEKLDRLTVLSFVGLNRHSHRIYECVCDCGQKVTKTKGYLDHGRNKSCGCLHIEIQKTIHIKHGRRYTPEYKSYVGARQRCLNPNNPAFNGYGGRGIEFRFGSFEEFYTYLGNKPAPEYSLDRIDNDGHYEPGNVRWASPKEQSDNRRVSVTAVIDGNIATARDLSKNGMVAEATILWRLHHGWCATCASSLPAHGERCPHKTRRNRWQ